MSEHDATADLFTVETPESVAFAYELAGLGSRGLALILDMLVIGLIAGVEIAAVVGVAVVVNIVSEPAFQTAAPWLLGGLLVLVFATWWGYFIVGEVFRNGRTWGKRRLGIRVVRDDGSRVSAADSTVRNLLRFVDMLPGNYAVGMFSILFSRRNKRLGDMAAGTVVVRDIGEDDLVLEAGGLEPRVLLAREYLDRRPKLTAPARMQVGVEVLATFGEQPDPGWGEETIAGRIADLSGWRDARGDAGR